MCARRRRGAPKAGGSAVSRTAAAREHRLEACIESFNSYAKSVNAYPVYAYGDDSEIEVTASLRPAVDAVEDAALVAAAREALAEGGETIPLEQVLDEIGYQRQRPIMYSCIAEPKKL